MRKRTHRKWLLRGLPLLLVAVAFGAGAWALTASNTVASGGAAGSGSGTISGYTVGTPTYNLDGSDSSKIASFTFSLSPATASTAVKAGLDDGTNPIVWADSGSPPCVVTGTGTASVTCTYLAASEPLVKDMVNLTVSAVN